MDTTANIRRFRLTPTRACAAAGLLALTGGGFTLAQHPAASPGPAARLKPPQALDEPARTVVGRGTAPDSVPAVSVHPSRTVPQPQPATRPMYSANRPAHGAAPVRATLPRDPSLAESAWLDLKGLVTGQPPGTTLPFHHPQSQVQTLTPPRPQPQPQPSARPTPGGVYAGPPAYRWYGWGTTTPGANAYAPTGQYPRGSANWYAQTGATPGAFPVPVMNPYRTEPNAEPPAYARGAMPDATTAPGARLASADAPPQLRYAPASAPVSTPVPVNTIPVPPGPPPAAVERADYPPVIAQSGPASGVVQSSAQSEVPAEGGLTWQRSAGETAPFVSPPPPPTVTVIRGMEPKAREPSLEDVVKVACHGKAAVTEVKQTGPTQLVVKVRAATAADARAAFAALSDVPTLKPYKVEFEADIK